MADLETELKPHVTMDEITALAKRRGFIFQSSEIYGGIGGFFDYGPLGAVLKRNVKDAWWHENVELRDDVVPFDSSIVMHPLTWKASGHIDVFHDMMVDCKNCKHRFRADHLKSLDGPCPNCGMRNSFTEPRAFNLMLKTYVGPMEDSASVAYLRPETAQGIFVNFKNIYQTARKKPPFGIAQIGKSFRNEITPGNFTFRMREFEQAEMEYFVPHDGHDFACYEQWVSARKAWYSKYGINAERLRFYELGRTRSRTMRRPAPTSSTSSRGAGVNSSRSRTAAPTISTTTSRSRARTSRITTRSASRSTCRS